MLFRSQIPYRRKFVAWLVCAGDYVGFDDVHDLQVDGTGIIKNPGHIVTPFLDLPMFFGHKGIPVRCFLDSPVVLGDFHFFLGGGKKGLWFYPPRPPPVRRVFCNTGVSLYHCITLVIQ